MRERNFKESNMFRLKFDFVIKKYIYIYYSFSVEIYFFESFGKLMKSLKFSKISVLLESPEEFIKTRTNLKISNFLESQRFILKTFGNSQRFLNA